MPILSLWGVTNTCEKAIKLVTSIFRVFLLFFCITAVSISPAYAAANDTPTVISVVTEPWAPYSYMENDRVVGTATEIVRKVLDETKIPYSINIYPWMRTLEQARRNRNTVIYTLINTPGRAREFEMIGQIAKSDTVSFYRLATRTDIKGTTLEELTAYRLATGRGSVMHEHLRARGIPATVTSETQLAMRLLAHGRVDLVLQSDAAFRAALKLLPEDAETFRAHALAFKTRGFMALGPDHDPVIAEKIKAAYKRLQEKGDIPTFD